MIRPGVRAALFGVVAGSLSMSAAAQTPIGSVDRGRVVIEGRVTDIFGNKFVLQDSSGRTLVETGPEWHRRIEAKIGERLKVIGRSSGAGFEAFRIVYQDGRELRIRAPEGPPPWAGGPDKGGL